ncbi:MAG TPA: hypothetical protein VFP54_10925 [Acidimicrobiales bacterium]|nr:hypothetical protein [Acidimicrobiales bacterium]
MTDDAAFKATGRHGLERTDEPRRKIVIRLGTGAHLPPTMSPVQLREYGLDDRSDHSIRSDCAKGVIPTLNRAGGEGARHRIATARYLEQLGIEFTIDAVPVSYSEGIG